MKQEEENGAKSPFFNKNMEVGGGNMAIFSLLKKINSPAIFVAFVGFIVSAAVHVVSIFDIDVGVYVNSATLLLLNFSVLMVMIVYGLIKYRNDKSERGVSGLFILASGVAWAYFFYTMLLVSAPHRFSVEMIDDEYWLVGKSHRKVERVSKERFHAYNADMNQTQYCLFACLYLGVLLEHSSRRRALKE